MTTALSDFIRNPTTAELELGARYGMQPEDARRERAFLAFFETGLPHRRMEAREVERLQGGAENAGKPRIRIDKRTEFLAKARLVSPFTPKGF